MSAHPLASLIRRVVDEDLRPIEVDPLVNPGDEGLYTWLVNDRLSGSSDVSVGLARMLPGQRHLRHQHPTASEFFFVIKGRCKFELAGTVVSGDSGTALYVPAGTSHALWNPYRRPCDLVFGYPVSNYDRIATVYEE